MVTRLALVDSSKTKTESKNAAIPKLGPKVHNYAEWILSVEMGLTMFDTGQTSTYWDIVTGQYPEAEAERRDNTQTYHSEKRFLVSERISRYPQ